MRQTSFQAISLLGVLGLAACSHTGELGTKPQSHVAATALIAGEAPALPFASYLVGIEKANAKVVGRFTYQCQAGQRYCFAINKLQGGARNRAESELDDPRTAFLSHIIRYGGPPLAPKNSASSIYNLYASAPRSTATAQSYVEASWNSLIGPFAQDLHQRVVEDDITHILLFSTGWNTLQAEALVNYRDWWSAILAEYERLCGPTADPKCMQSGLERFRPLFIAVSWDSDWPRARLAGVEDYVNKASDADGIGLTWANLLINMVLKDVRAKHGTPIVAVGHSFGARLLSRAVHSAPLIGASSRDPVDLFIGLQGAFSYKRFIPGEGIEGAPYAGYATASEKFLFTTSTYDAAVDNAAWTTFIGSDRAFTATKDPSLGAQFEHRILDELGNWNAPPSQDSKRITMLEASQFINGHNDVYNRATARLILSAIFEFAPTIHLGDRTIADE